MACLHQDPCKTNQNLCKCMQMTIYFVSWKLKVITRNAGKEGFLTHWIIPVISGIKFCYKFIEYSRREVTEHAHIEEFSCKTAYVHFGQSEKIKQNNYDT